MCTLVPRCVFGSANLCGSFPREVLPSATPPLPCRGDRNTQPSATRGANFPAKICPLFLQGNLVLALHFAHPKVIDWSADRNVLKTERSVQKKESTIGLKTCFSVEKHYPVRFCAKQAENRSPQQSGFCISHHTCFIGQTGVILWCGLFGGIIYDLGV